MELKTRIDMLIQIVSKNVFEKEIVFKLAFLAMLSGESIFVLGKPGIAKSMIARRIKFALKSGKIFEYLMNRFSTPEEIFGSISIKELQEGRYVRNIENYLPAANIAFLDEIWKSSPSILNNLLTILNEKIFRNNGVDIKVPLWLLISASNELPETDKSLEALYDRFIIRYIAQPLIKQSNFNNMLSVTAELDVTVDSELQIGELEYWKWLEECKNIIVDELTLEFINIFRKSLKELSNGEAYISDRRWTKIVKIMRSSAYYNGRNKISKLDWLIIPYCIWDTYEQEIEYRKLFNKIFKENLMLDIKLKKAKITKKINDILNEIKEIESGQQLAKRYEGIFKNQFKDSFFHKINGLSNVYPFCYILESDYLKILLNPHKIYKAQLFVGMNQDKFEKIITANLKYKHDAKLIVFKENLNTKKEIVFVEKKENYNIQNIVNDLEKEFKMLSQEYNDIKKENSEEIAHLKSESNIFFNNDFNLLINEFLQEEKIKNSMSNVGNINEKH